MGSYLVADLSAHVVVLLCFERGACALRNNLGSYPFKHSLISTASSGRGDDDRNT
jgi:hypothetical protein